MSFFFINTTPFRSLPRVFFRRIAEKVIVVLGRSEKTVGFSLHLVGVREIRVLNSRYQKKDQATDVLSFPLHSSEEISVCYGKDDILELGDIFISPQFIRQNLKSKGDLKKSVARVFIHGLLHLWGYDHERSSGEAKKMFVLQRKIERLI